MTGFARVQVETRLHHVTLEMKSVNHRYLDVQFRMPRNLNVIEEALKARLTKSIARGRVEVFITIVDKGQLSSKKIDQQLLRQIVEQIKPLSEEYGIEQPLTWETLLNIPGIWQEASAFEMEEEVLCQTVQAGFDQAVEALLLARQKEGAELERQLILRMEECSKRLTGLQRAVGKAAEMHFAKLKERLKALLGDIELDPQRLAQEIAILADRMSVDEEMVRFGIHIQHFLDVLKSDVPVGRKLDFLLQEMNREINTIGSKSADIAIAQAVVEVKTILEQCREQIQNLE